MDRTVEEARAFLIEKTGIEPTTVTKRDNGFFFHIENLNRGAMDVFGTNLDYPQEQDYCLLETTNDDDVGRYQETMRYDMPPHEGHGFHAEVHYTRSLTGGDPHEDYKAEVEGVLWLTTPDTHEALREECDSSYYLRTVEHVVREIHGMGNLLSTVAYLARKSSADAQAQGRKQITDVISHINRTLIRSQ